ncbi:MAG: OsmC family protein [Dokdonella sp.]
MSDTRTFSISLSEESDYVFRIAFDETPIPDLRTDEESPLGGDSGPNPGRLLVAAVANCLSASLLFALRKFKNTPGPITARATGRLERNAEKRWRIGQVEVEIDLPGTAADYSQLERLLGQFEDFCIVTESVRNGIPVEVKVRDAAGDILHDSTRTASPTATWMI